MKSQRGQALLIVVLIMVIALTVGLSLASRSIITLNNTSEEANSQKAFQAAEAGIEIGLAQPMSGMDIAIGTKPALSNGAIIQSVDITPLIGSQVIVNGGNPVSEDNGIDVWLTNYPDYSGTPWTGKMNIYWGTTTGCKDAALEIVVVSGSSATDPNASINRYGIDPCGTNSIDASQNRTGNNHFSPAVNGATIGNIPFNFSTAITINDGLIARIIPLYANTPVAVVGKTSDGSQDQALPLQGRTITSLGTFKTTERKISFFQTFPQVPVEYFYSVMQP